MTPLLKIEYLQKRFGALAVTDSVTLDVFRTTCHALIGPNGAGKTTLIHQIAGALAPDSGHIRFDGNDITHLPIHRRVRAGICRTFQISNHCARVSVLDNIALAIQAQDESSLRCWRNARADHARFEAANRIAARVGLVERIDTLAGHLAHGEQRLLELGIALATAPKLLLLDEPMAGIGADEAPRMFEILRSLRAEVTMVLVEHDMDTVFRLADTVSVLVAGQIVATGTPQEIRGHPDVQRAYLGETQPIT